MTFPTGVIEIRKCSDEELKAMLDEARETSKHSRKLGRVLGIVAAHRLQQMKEFLAYEELATWRRMDGFDRIAADDNQRASLPLPLTPEQFTQSLWSEVNALKDEISMPAKNTVTRPRQKTMDVVDGRRSDSLDELLVNFEFARIKEYLEKPSRDKAAQAQVTVTPVGIVQYCSPCLLDPEPSSSVYVKLENPEGKMGPELEELESPSAGTSLETPGQQCPPNEGTWDQGRTTTSGILTAGVGSCQRTNTSSPTTESVDKRAKDTKTIEDISSTAATPENRRRKTPSKHNKQFDSGGKGEKVPLWNAAVTLLSFSGESWETPCLFSVCVLCVLCFPKLFFFSGDDFSAS